MKRALANLSHFWTNAAKTTITESDGVQPELGFTGTTQGGLLVEVERKMHIYAHEKAKTILDGQYGSTFKGRSMDFDDLREYVLGDDVKDIDWKATARSQTTLIKRYVAIRKHNILLVANTGRSMAAMAPGGESKRNVALMAAGIMASVVLNHDDLIGLVAGSASSKTEYVPLSGARVRAEKILQRISHISLNSGVSHLEGLLDYVARTQSRRLILVIISDDQNLSDAGLVLLRRLRAQHEIMFIRIESADIMDPALRSDDVYDIAEPNGEIPLYLRENAKLLAASDELRKNQTDQFTDALNHLAIAHTSVRSEKTAMHQIMGLMERQKYVRK